MVLADGWRDNRRVPDRYRDPGDVTIPGGGWEFHYWAYVSSTAGGTVTTIKFQIGKVDTNGLFTEFFTTAPTTITATTNGAAQEVRSQYVVPDNTYTLASTDRVAVRVVANNSSATARVAHFIYQGTARGAHVDTTFSVSAPQGVTGQQALPDRWRNRRHRRYWRYWRNGRHRCCWRNRRNRRNRRDGRDRPDRACRPHWCWGDRTYRTDRRKPAASEAQVAQAGQAVRVAPGGVGPSGPQGHLARPGLRVRRRPASCGCRRQACGRPPQRGCAVNTKVETPTNHVNYYALDFPDSGITSAEVTVGMPSDWNAGTVTAQFYWTGIADTTTNAVVWGIEGRSYGDGDALEAAYGTQVTVSDANASTANQVRISAATGAVTITGATASEVVQFRIQRLPADGSDTLGATARLLGVMITFVRS